MKTGAMSIYCLIRIQLGLKNREMGYCLYDKIFE